MGVTVTYCITLTSRPFAMGYVIFRHIPQKARKACERVFGGGNTPARKRNGVPGVSYSIRRASYAFANSGLSRRLSR